MWSTSAQTVSKLFWIFEKNCVRLKPTPQLFTYFTETHFTYSKFTHHKPRITIYYRQPLTDYSAPTPATTVVGLLCYEWSWINFQNRECSHYPNIIIIVRCNTWHTLHDILFYINLIFTSRAQLFSYMYIHYFALLYENTEY